MTDTKTVTVDLGKESGTLEDRMATGRYASPSEVVREALQALEREDAMLDELLDETIQEADLGARSAAGDADLPMGRTGN